MENTGENAIILPDAVSSQGVSELASWSVQHPDTSIVTQTRMGTNIENTQTGGRFLPWEEHQASVEKNAHPGAVFRGEPTRLYNCHGLVFASRRTGIYQSRELGKILKEDGYEKIGEAEALPGDVVIYLAPDTGDFEHSAVVIAEPKEDALGIPRVLSKWGQAHEVVHYANDCPYNYDRVEYYRVKKVTCDGNHS